MDTSTPIEDFIRAADPKASGPLPTNHQAKNLKGVGSIAISAIEPDDELYPVSFRVTKAELELLELWATGSSKSAIIRKLLFGSDHRPKKIKVPVKSATMLAKILGVLGAQRIATNLNVIARAQESGSPLPSEECERLFQQISREHRFLRTTLLRALGIYKGDCAS